MSELVESYLHYIQEPNFMLMTESDMKDYITEAFFKLDKNKIKKQIVDNAKRNKSLLKKYGIDIKKATKSDALLIIKAIKKGYDTKKTPVSVAKDLGTIAIKILKRIWTQGFIFGRKSFVWYTYWSYSHISCDAV